MSETARIETPRLTLYCSFCGKSEREVKYLIAGPTVFICSECVDLCNEIIRDRASVTASAVVTVEDLMPEPAEPNP